MHRWMPWPNARWALFGTRNGSKPSGIRAGRLGVAVGAGQRGEQHVALLDVLAEQLHVLLGEPRERHLHHREVAQQLVDDAVDLLRRSVPDQGRVLGVAQQHDRAERDHAGRRLEPAGEDAVGEPGEVDVADRVALLADDVAEQPGAGMQSLTGDRVEQELPLLRHRAERAHRPASRRTGRCRAWRTRPGPRSRGRAGRRSSGTAPGRPGAWRGRPASPGPPSRSAACRRCPR